MTNNLKELDKILEQCPTCKGDGFTAEHEDGCDGNCNFCPVQVQCDHCHAKGYYVDKQDVLTLINQKEKEARLKFANDLKGYDFGFYEGFPEDEAQELTERMLSCIDSSLEWFERKDAHEASKRLKEELNKKGK